VKPRRAESAAGGTLRELQRSFLAGVRGEEVDAALFAAPPASSAEARFGVYREGYEIRLADVMKNDYPAVERILGPGPWRSLIHRYLAVHPPSSHDVSRAGDHLARHLENDPLTADLPFLPDLARFEAALSAAVVAADLAPPTREDLEALGDDLFEHPLAFVPGAAYLVSAWPLGDLWQLRNKADDEIALRVEGRPSSLVVHRRGLKVLWREVDSDEATFLAAVDGRRSLTELCDSREFGEPEDAAPRLIGLLLPLLDATALRFAPPTRTPAGVHSTQQEETHR
jgi:hypothetical protein